jgi:hypothetical protein
MISNIHAFTKIGKIKRPSYSTIATWVKESWDKVDEDLIQRSFKSCGISANTDGSEDDYIFNDNLLHDTDDEVVENSDNLNVKNHEEYPEEAYYENEWDVEVGQEEDNDESESDDDDNYEYKDSEEEDNDESESEGDDNYEYKDSDDDNDEIQRRLTKLKKKYRVKNFFMFVLFYSDLLLIYITVICAYLEIRNQF